MRCFAIFHMPKWGGIEQFKRNAMTIETVISKMTVRFISLSWGGLYGTCLSGDLARLFQKTRDCQDPAVFAGARCWTRGSFVFFIFWQLFLFSSSVDQWAVWYRIIADQIITGTFWPILDRDRLRLILGYHSLMQRGLFAVLQYYCSLNAEFYQGFFISIYGHFFFLVYVRMSVHVYKEMERQKQASVGKEIK